MSALIIYHNLDRDSLTFEIPIDRVNDLRKRAGYGDDMFRPGMADYATADVIGDVFGWQEFMYRGYAAVMREALSHE